MDRGRGNRGSRGNPARGASNRGNARGRGRGRGRARGGGSENTYIPRYPIGARQIQEALDDPSADLGALVATPGFRKLLSLDSMTGENKIYGQFKKTLELTQRLFQKLPRNGLIYFQLKKYYFPAVSSVELQI